MRNTLHFLLLLALAIFFSQAWSATAAPAYPCKYDAGIKYTTVENTESGGQNYTYDNIGNLQYYGVETITSYQENQIRGQSPYFLLKQRPSK